MTAKEYMSQLEKLDAIIENKIREKERWQEIARGTGSSFSDAERVQSSGNPHKMQDAVIRYIGLENEIERYIDKLVDTRQEIISTIEQLNATHYDVLHKIYVQRLSLKEIAAIKGQSYSWVTTMHGRALQNVQRILNKRV